MSEHPTSKTKADDTRAAKAAQKAIKKAVQAAGRKLPFKSERSTEEMLEFAAGSLAEAYRIGAEEAQGEIINRLRHIERMFDGGQP